MTLNELIENYNLGTSYSFTFFWGSKGPKNKLTNAVFSQWYLRDFSEDNVTYCCCEQYMMAKKAELFNDKEIYDKIMASKDPKTIKALGRKVKNFEDKIWKVWCDKIVEQGNYLKFSQNEDLKEYLLNTNDSILVEASPYDSIWGIKMSKDDPSVTNPNTWKGLNKLGFALTNVRERLK